MRASAAAAAPVSAAEAATPNPWLVTGVVMLGMIMSIVDASIVNVAVPHMMGTLGAGVSEVSWVVTAYTLANVIVIPLSAWMGSVFGRTRLYGAAIVVFTVASVLCGLAPNLTLLVAARILQGASAGVMMPTGQSILFESFPPEKRGASMAVFGLGVMVGPAIGPTLGGFITDTYGWPWIFYINLPIGILAALAVPAVLRDPPWLKRRANARGDVVGILLLAGSIGLLQYVLEKGEDAGWFDADWIVASIAAAVLMGVGFVIWELDHPEPAVDLRVFADKNFGAAALVNVGIGVGLMGGMFMLPLFLQQLLGFNATQSGMALVPGALATALFMPIAGRLSDRVDARFLSGFGLVVFAGSMLLMSRLDARAGEADLLLPQVLRGVGMAFCFVPLNVAAMAKVSRERIGQATGLYNLTRQLGGSLGIAWLASLVGRYRVQHTADLVANVTPWTEAARVQLQGMTAAAMGLGFPAGEASSVAMRMVYGRVMKAAAELAFRDMFLTIVALFVGSLPLLLLLERRKPSDRPGIAVAAHD